MSPLYIKYPVRFPFYKTRYEMDSFYTLFPVVRFFNLVSEFIFPSTSSLLWYKSLFFPSNWLLYFLRHLCYYVISLMIHVEKLLFKLMDLLYLQKDHFTFSFNRILLYLLNYPVKYIVCNFHIFSSDKFFLSS